MNNKESFKYKHYLRVIKRLTENNILPLFSFENYNGVKEHYTIKCKMCNFEFVSSFDNGQLPKCPKCIPNRLTINYGHPDNVNISCKYCNKIFNIIWKKRKQQFCSILCKNEYIKKNKREMAKCLACGKLFERYKYILHSTSGKLTQYCSNKCNRNSNEHNERSRKLFLLKNPMNKQECRDKIKHSKFERYGDENYNNMEKNIQTCMLKYGVLYTCYLPQCKSNGKRVSIFQKRIFIDVNEKYPDAELEKYLPDVRRFVDIYIPSIKKVIECHGDYWHCNPSKCLSTYYNKMVHLTASEIWDRDRQKKMLLENAGYNVEIIWENTSKRFKHCTQ